MNQEIIELLEKARSVTASDCYKNTEIWDVDDLLDQALALLRTEQLPAGEFTKKMDIWFEWCLTNLDTIRASVNPVCFKLYDKVITGIKDIRKECFGCLDASEASRKELLDNLKMIVALLCHPGSFVSAKDIEKANAAIAKATKDSDKPV